MKKPNRNIFKLNFEGKEVDSYQQLSLFPDGLKVAFYQIKRQKGESFHLAIKRHKASIPVRLDILYMNACCVVYQLPSDKLHSNFQGVIITPKME